MNTLEHQLGETDTRVNEETAQQALAYVRRKGQPLEVEQALGLAPYEAYVKPRNTRAKKVVRTPGARPTSSLGGTFDA